MSKVGLSVKVLIFAAYVLAMLVPVLSVGGQQTQAEHARMMAMAGHEMSMADVGGTDTDKAQIRLCRQRCLVAVATLPVTGQATETVEHAAVVVASDIALVSSLAFPPAGHPPKVALI